jgi:tetratricopeptide (TPR) repeat protein
MAVAPATKGVLLVAFVAALSALCLAMGLSRWSPVERGAPEAWSALEGHDAEQAASLFAHALQQRPRDPQLLFGAASAAYALGRNDSALASLRRAVDLDPQFADALSLLGQVAYDRGDTTLAIRSMEKASVLHPRDRRVTELLDRWRHEARVHDSYVEKPVEHFRILYEGGTQSSIGERVARTLEREYSRIGKALNSYPSETLTVVLYTNQEFQDITRSPSWATGEYDGRIRVAVGGALQSAQALDRIVTHELVHAIVANVAPRHVPTWLNEGLASYYEMPDRLWATDALRQATRIVPLDALSHGFAGLDDQTALVAYAESATAAEILCAELGPRIAPFLEMIGRGRSVDQALLEFQIQPNAFESEWRRRVGIR